MPRSTYYIAAILIVAMGGWLASGMFRKEATVEPPAVSREPVAQLVEVIRSHASQVTRHVVVQGDVQAFRKADARAQTAGRIAEILVNIGEQVGAGKPVARLTPEGRESQLREARAILERRQADYDAIAELLEKGFATQARARELRTELESARESVRQIEQELQNTIVESPFSGVVDQVAVEPGEYVGVNAEVATLIDNSPLRVVVRINQQDMASISTGATAQVAFATGGSETGRVCFVSAAADPQTRTFRVEVRTPNIDNKLPSGTSAEVSIAMGQTPAHFVSPAILSLGIDGTIGVKTASAEGTVEFYPVNIVRAQTNGVWVSGLPEAARIITVGQGFVQSGDRVRIAERPDDVQRADAPPAEPPFVEAVSASVPPSEICSRKPALEGAAIGARAFDAESRTEVADAGAFADDLIERPPSPSGATEDVGEDEPDVSSETVITEVQRGLNQLGFDAGRPDGRIGERTLSALAAYRSANGLPASGGLDGAIAQRIISDAESGPQARTQP